MKEAEKEKEQIRLNFPDLTNMNHKQRRKIKAPVTLWAVENTKTNEIKYVNFSTAQDLQRKSYIRGKKGKKIKSDIKIYPVDLTKKGSIK